MIAKKDCARWQRRRRRVLVAGILRARVRQVSGNNILPFSACPGARDRTAAPQRTQETLLIALTIGTSILLDMRACLHMHRYILRLVLTH